MVRTNREILAPLPDWNAVGPSACCLLPPMFATTNFALRTLLTLAAAWAAAQLCLALHTPLPWMLGPLVATALCSIAGAPTASWNPLRNMGQWTMGTALGLYFTPHVVTWIAGLWWAIGLTIVWALLLGWGFGVWMYRHHAGRMPGVDAHQLRTTSYFACSIGAASEMTLLAEREHARTDLVAASHSLRVLIVTLSIPLLLQWLGMAGDGPRGLPPVRGAVGRALAAGGWLYLPGCAGLARSRHTDGHGQRNGRAPRRLSDAVFHF